MVTTFHPINFLRSDHDDQTVHSGEWLIGRIWKDPDGSGDLGWHWSLFAAIPAPRSISRYGHTDSLDKAKDEFGNSWSKLLTWAGLEAIE